VSVFVCEALLKAVAFGRRYLLVVENGFEGATVLLSLVVQAGLFASGDEAKLVSWRMFFRGLRLLIWLTRFHRCQSFVHEMTYRCHTRGAFAPAERAVGILHAIKHQYELSSQDEQNLEWLSQMLSSGDMFQGAVGGRRSSGKRGGDPAMDLGADMDQDTETGDWITKNFSHGDARMESKLGAADSLSLNLSTLGGGGISETRQRTHTQLAPAVEVRQRKTSLQRLFTPHGTPDRQDDSDAAGAAGAAAGSGKTLAKRMSLRMLKSTLPDCSELVSEPELELLNSKIEEWDFDVFHLDAVSAGRALFVASITLLRKHNLIQNLELVEPRVVSFFLALNDGYRAKNPYHNHVHAADVLVSTNYFLRCEKMAGLREVDVFAALFAAAVHDFEHPGTNNTFHVATCSPVATLYNDKVRSARLGPLPS
jgi:hypothetical protein